MISRPALQLAGYCGPESPQPRPLEPTTCQRSKGSHIVYEADGFGASTFYHHGAVLREREKEKK